jgi:hypothetical protein
MAWERRGKQRFYYRSIKVNGRVKKIYFGRGREAELAALAAERRYEERTRRAARLQQQRDCCRQMEEALGELNAELDLLTRGVAVAAGFSERDGQFRRRSCGANAQT